MKTSLMGPSLNIPIRNGRLALGTWQGMYESTDIINISDFIACYFFLFSFIFLYGVQHDDVIIGVCNNLSLFFWKVFTSTNIGIKAVGVVATLVISSSHSKVRAKIYNHNDIKMAMINT